MFAAIVGSMLAKGLDEYNSIALSFYIQKYAYSYTVDIASTKQPADIINATSFAYNKIVKIIKGI